MAFLRYLILTISVLVATQQPTFAQEQLQTRLVGMWDEIHPSDNLVYFAKDGSWKLYLEKEEIGKLRTLIGKWTLSNDSKLTITFTIEGQAYSQSAKLSFDGQDMVLTDENRNETRHRRHKGPIPERFQQ